MVCAQGQEGGKVLILTLPASPPEVQGVIFSFRTDTSIPHIPGCPRPPQGPRHPAPSPDLFLFWRQEAERAEDLTLSPLLPASLPLPGGHQPPPPTLSLVARPRCRDQRQTRGGGNPNHQAHNPPNSSGPWRHLTWTKPQMGLGWAANEERPPIFGKALPGDSVECPLLTPPHQPRQLLSERPKHPAPPGTATLHARSQKGL